MTLENVNAGIVRSLLESLNAYSHLGQHLNICHSPSSVKFPFCMLPNTELEEFGKVYEPELQKDGVPFVISLKGVPTKAVQRTQEQLMPRACRHCVMSAGASQCRALRTLNLIPSALKTVGASSTPTVNHI